MNAVWMVYCVFGYMMRLHPLHWGKNVPII